MKKYSLHILIFIILFVLFPYRSLSQTTIIKGIVKENEEILVAATVSVDNKATLTDHKGRFSIGVKPGNYLLTVTYAGYKKYEQVVSVSSGQAEFLEINMIKDEQISEAVIVGSRSLKQRSNLSTPVPVDAFSSIQLIQTGQTSLTQMLNFIAPSLNASRQVYNEPATLRGLDPEHTLILMNGIRYHNMAWTNQGNIRGQLGRGSVGNDLNSIPFPAIEKIEILRDGASAQYGSDAVAGVMNIVLRESTDKTYIQLHTGQFYKGDGGKIYIALNRGISLNKKGFLNLSGDFRYQAPTYRGGEYLGLVYKNYKKNSTHTDSVTTKALDDAMIQARNFSRKTPVSVVGNTKLVSFGFLANGGYYINNHIELFWTGTINDRRIFYIGAYRFPKDSNQVNTNLYPDGFKVRINTNTLDVSAIAGIKGETKKNWHWELSNSYGSNSVANNSSNTNNASQSYLGKNAPTAFYLGKQIYKQLTNDINFVKGLTKIPLGLKSLNLGFGAEWRIENFHSKAGEEASWYNYDTINRKKEGGSQGFAGVSDSDAINKNRNVAGIYLDLESELNDRFLIDLAGRYEYYNDFGGNIAGKVAAHYKFSDKFSLRGSVSNGFRAPSLQQRCLSSTQTVWKSSAGVQVSAIRAIFPNNHEVTRAFDIPSLTAENTINISGGFTASLFDHINMTIDAYWIQIKNRIVLSGTFDTTNADVKQILSSHPGIDQVQFFTNAVNTRTRGIDIVVNKNWNIRKTSFSFMLATNFTRTNVFGKIKTTDKLHADSLLFNTEEKTKLEKGQLDNKVILNMNYKKGKIGFNVCNTRFGKTATTTLVRNSVSVDTLYEFFSSKILTDIRINYSPKTWLTITAGINNIFDVYPARLKNYGNTREGIFRYSNDASPFGYNGGYYYLNMMFNF
jgi:iron complex outermembrane receptor protein